MLLYNDCSVFKRGRFWIFRDDALKIDFAKFTESQFYAKDFHGNDKVNEFEIIRQWRDAHPIAN